MATHGRRWLEGLPVQHRANYARWVLPRPDAWVVAGLKKQAEVLRRQQEARKAEVAAVVPSLMQIRAQAHFRFNQLERMRRAYLEARREAEGRDRAGLPIEITYDDGGDAVRGLPPRRRLRFRLWDRRSFVLAHTDAYDTRKGGREYLRKVRAGGFGPGWNTYLLEYMGAEPVGGASAVDLDPWFIELIRRDVLGGGWHLRGTAPEIASKQAWLRGWGYGDEETPRGHTPFAVGVGGLLSWERSGDATFTRHGAAEGHCWIPIEGLYAGALFGVLAVDVFTTTGMRMNEALQIRIEKDCFLELTVPAPQGAADQRKRSAWVFRLIPKGERENKPQTYRVDDQVRRQIAKTTWYLAVEHYRHAGSEALPKVAYARGVREQRFPPGRYLFQHRRRALTNMDINACMRFLLHGMAFTTAEGEPVSIKSHLLRHVVATYLLQVEQVPIDIVAEILKHKNLQTTAYYGKATPAMVDDRLDGYLARFAGALDFEEDVLRAPAEVKEQLEEARERMGVLLEVAGGTCTQPGYCPVKTACIGCPCNAPDPSKRRDPERARFWAERERERAIREGRPMDARRLEQTIRDCDVLLKEMALVEAWQKDEVNDAQTELVVIA
jgi:hypothetical protein